MAFILANTSGWRRARRRAAASAPLVGTGASSTSAGVGWRSAVFCTTSPPMEWPMSTGAVGSVALTASTSAT